MEKNNNKHSEKEEEKGRERRKGRRRRKGEKRRKRGGMEVVLPSWRDLS
jgi:hypothetical protein